MDMRDYGISEEVVYDSDGSFVNPYFDPDSCDETPIFKVYLAQTTCSIG